MYVESCPRDGSDPEAVSGSSTMEEDLGKNKIVENKPSGLFLI